MSLWLCQHMAVGCGVPSHLSFSLATWLLWCMVTWLVWCISTRGCYSAAVPSAAKHQQQVQLTDVKLRFAPDRWYNPSLVQYGSEVICAIKRTDMRNINGKTWWFNTIHLCSGSWADMSSELACDQLQPWGDSFQECELDGRVRGGKVDSSGLGDVKVWVWPGRGVYAVFGTKPHHAGICTEQVVYHQWLMQIEAAAEQAKDDPWRLVGRTPLALKLAQPHLMYESGKDYVMEKNWMPWVYKEPGTGAELLMMTYMVRPHIVLQLQPDGVAVERYRTHSSELMERFSAYDIHGGPPVVYMPGSISGTGQPYYLGIMHHIERSGAGRMKLYRHFAYKFQDQPPFEVTAVSDELPLTFNSTYKARLARVAFVTGLYLDEDKPMLHISYGAADIESRLLSLSVQAMESLFTGAVAFQPANIRQQGVEGKEQADAATTTGASKQQLRQHHKRAPQHHKVHHRHRTPAVREPAGRPLHRPSQ